MSARPWSGRRATTSNRTRGATIALLNSDDGYAAARLERLCAALAGEVMLAFSDVALIDDDDRPTDGTYARMLRQRIDEAEEGPRLLRALVRHNVATSTGNLVFRRPLLEATGSGSYAWRRPSTRGGTCWCSSHPA